MDSLRRSRLLLGVVAAIVVLPVLAGIARAGALPLGEALKSAWGFVDPTDTEVLPLRAVLIWIPFALAAAALIVWRPRWFIPAAIALTMLDLARAGMGQNPAIGVAHAKTPETPAMAYLRDGRFVAVGGSSAGITPLTANVGMRYGLSDGRGYDYPTIQRYDDLWRRAVVKPDPLGLTLPSTQASTTPSALRAMGLLNVTRILQPPGEAPLGGEPVYDGPDGRVYRNEAALPRAFVVGREQVTDDQLGGVLEVDPTETAVVSERLGLSGGGSAKVIIDEPEHVLVDANARGRSLLVLSDTYFPGWKAQVGGRDAEIVRVNHLQRGVVIPAGTSTVEFTYAPASWRIAWIVTLLTAAGLLVAVWRRR